MERVSFVSQRLGHGGEALRWAGKTAVMYKTAGMIRALIGEAQALVAFYMWWS